MTCPDCAGTGWRTPPMGVATLAAFAAVGGAFPEPCPCRNRGALQLADDRAGQLAEACAGQLTETEVTP